MQCPSCGIDVTNGAEICSGCGQRVAGAPAEAPTEDPAAIAHALPVVAKRPLVYAGFWLRAVAYVIDSLVVSMAMGVFVLQPLLAKNHVGTSLRDLWNFYNSGSQQAMAFALLIQMANWLYFASFESSAWQATPGKKILGLDVTDLQGRRIGFGRASGRYFGKLISGMLFLVGFAMAGFTAKKQALHDLMAKCLVLKKI